MKALPIIVTLTILVNHTTAQCSDSQPIVRAPHQNPWAALSIKESTSVAKHVEQSLNLTGNRDKPESGFLSQVYALQPNKSKVLPFLNGSGDAPARYARATVVHFSASESYWQEYMIGPLPITDSTPVKPLAYPFNKARPGRTEVPRVFSTGEVGQFQTILGEEIEDITREIWNTTFAEGLSFRLGTPLWEENGHLISWASITGSRVSKISSETLLPYGVFTRIDFTSNNWEEWAATGWFTGGRFYSSTDDFREAVFSDGFKKPQPNVDGPWTSTDKQGEAPPLDKLPPPVPASQGQKRFWLDKEQNYVSWMDFSFYFSFSMDIGLSLYNIQYKNKRLIYELSLQEAFTHYTGSEPFASQTTFWDTGSGMGLSSFPLVKGYDCPSYATYLGATFSMNDNTMTRDDAICIFEHDAGYPIRRHGSFPQYTSVAKNIIFTVRTISTVGNYDYLIDYNFFYDGAIEVSVRLSGYISAEYWDGNEEYGFHIHDYLSGSLHDHVLTFKADFDILGEKNSVQKVKLEPVTAEYPWSPGNPRNTMRAIRSFVTNEDDASIKWADNDNSLYAIVNKDSPNRFGEFPGYRIKRSAITSHLTFPNSSNAGKAANFALHDLYITKQKDTEPRAADPSNGLQPEDPLVDFAKFLDGESIEQEDLVVWFNLGTHHMPHTGDLPNTMFTSAHSAMRFEPLNYLPNDPSIAVSQQVRVDYNEEGGVENVERFGGRHWGNCNVYLDNI
ncbi:amine oxidase catalytic domain-containing protein [Lojkania enalia]|uniref:Amine oxidase n=1 Tax=Lojkania enalia TaxID=147567 RepID=A0A9P4NAH5_9PLEO|nr:amine oxidase catalytic domain-containing protein [Didymosphaeria enalia]